MVQWRIDGNFTQSDVSQEDALPVTDAPVVDKDTVDISISAVNASTEVSVRFFDQLGENGYPQAGDIGTSYECAIDGTGVCGVTLNEDGSGVLTLRPGQRGDGKAVMLVVQAFYPTLEDADMDENIPDYSISWAVRDAAQ